MSINVRPARTDDAKEIARIHVDAWQTAYKNMMPQDFLNSLNYADREQFWTRVLLNPGRGNYLVAEYESKVQGFAVYGSARDEDLASSSAGELGAINVAPACWAKGIGKSLVGLVLEKAIESRWQSLHLWVVSANQRAISFYQGLGFVSEHLTKEDSVHANSPIHETRFCKYLMDIPK